MVAVRERYESYAARPPPLYAVAEPAGDPLSEADLSLLWQGQRFPAAALRTPDGEPVHVVFPGHRGGAAGPDFRDAVVRLAGSERRGDVELHVRASYWHAHGHHLDSAYDGVVLHVVYLADAGALTPLSNGSATPVAALAPWLAQRQQELQRWLAGPALWREPCQDSPARLGEEGVAAALAREGLRRFEARVAALQAESARLGELEALWRALLDAAGYGGDRDAFRTLALRFSASLAGRIVALAGDAKQRRVVLGAALKAVAGLATPGGELAGLLPRPIECAPRGGGRPASRPERRLESLSALFVRAEGDLLAYVESTVAAAVKPAQLVTAWQAEGLGPERAAEVVLNVVLPFAALRPALRERALALAAALPAQRPYGKTAFLEANLRRADGRRLVRRAQEQQGLLSLLGEWCSRGGCGRCPLS